METWINQQLHDLLGFSDNNLVEFIQKLATQSESLQSLQKQIIDKVNLPKNKKTHVFIIGIYKKLSPEYQQKRKNEYKLKELLEQITKVQNNQDFVDMDSKSQENIMKTRKKLRKDQQEKGKIKTSKPSKKVKKSKEQLQREDIKEQDALDKRLREIKAKKSKRVTLLGKNPQFALQTITKQERKKLVVEIKRARRQEYLEKRVCKQVMLANQEIEDEKIFDDMKLSYEEQEILNLKKKMLKFVSEQIHKKMDQKNDYLLPNNDTDDVGNGLPLKSLIEEIKLKK